MPAGVDRERVRGALEAVMDPEIPVVSVLDMGMIGDVEVDGARVCVTVLPTFSGCPAVREIQRDVRDAIRRIDGVAEVEVRLSYDPPWTTDRITGEGRRRLEEFGLAPPAGDGPVLVTSIGLPAVARCPYCGGTDTALDNAFGPTPCRAVYYCRSCRNPFEQFKPV